MAVSNAAETREEKPDIFSDLFTVVSGGNLVRVRSILEDDFPLQTFKNLSSTLLHQAANNLQCKVLQYLILHGANVNGKNAQQMTPLHVAAHKGDSRSVRMLLMNSADVNGVDYDNRTPLYFSVYDGHVKCVEVILQEENVDISIIRNGGWSPLHEASRFGHYDCIQLLLKCNGNVNIMAKTDDAWWTPGHMAASCGKLDCLLLLIEAGIDVNVGGGPNHTSTLLHEAAHNGHTDVVQLLLESGADASLFDGHDLPHHLASRYGHAEVLDILLTHFTENKKLNHLINAFTNVDPVTNALTYHNALHMASLYGRKECILVLLKHKAKHLPNGMGHYPVMLTAYKMHIDCMKVLLGEIKKDKKANGDKILETEGHLTALHHLCMKTYKTTDKSIACACLLLNSGLIDINQSDEEWDIPPCLFLAARNGTVGMVQYLLNSGADPNLCGSLQNFVLNNPNIHKCADLIIDAKEEPKSLLLISRIKIRDILFRESSIDKVYDMPIARFLKTYIYHGHYHGVRGCE